MLERMFLVFFVCMYVDKIYKNNDFEEMVCDLFIFLKVKCYGVYLLNYFVVDNMKFGGKLECVGVIYFRKEVFYVVKKFL